MTRIPPQLAVRECLTEMKRLRLPTATEQSVARVELHRIVRETTISNADDFQRL